MCASNKGIITRQLRRTSGCGMKTALFLAHRIREAKKIADECSPHRRERSRRRGGRKLHRRKGGAKLDKPPGEKQIVMAPVERNGTARSIHVPIVRAGGLHSVLDRRLSRPAHLGTDELAAYRQGQAGSPIERPVEAGPHKRARANSMPTVSRPRPPRDDRQLQLRFAKGWSLYSLTHFARPRRVTVLETGLARKRRAPTTESATRLPGKRIPMAVRKSEEHWSEYTLADGTIVRLRPILIDVNKVEGKYNQAGEPVYEFRSGGVVDVRVPEKLRLKR